MCIDSQSYFFSNTQHNSSDLNISKLAWFIITSSRCVSRDAFTVVDDPYTAGNLRDACDQTFPR